MNRKLLFLSLSAAFLLIVSWPHFGFSPLIFMAWIPLLLLEQHIITDTRFKSKHLFLYSYLTFFLWNLGTTWWIYYASAGGAAMAILCNALLMAFTFQIYHLLRKKINKTWNVILIIPVWIAFEYLHLDWDLTWPWLTLGNNLASFPQLVQWYEFTGVFGGSLWILSFNVILFHLYYYRNTLYRDFKRRIIITSALILIVFIPTVFSLLLYYNFEDRQDPTTSINVVVVQPNIDPYRKFSSDFKEQLQRMTDLAVAKTDTSTDYLVMPETALVEDIWENEMQYSFSIRRLSELSKRMNGVKIITGASTARFYAENETLSATARKLKMQPGYYDNYNTAVYLDSTGKLDVYHKSKLVPGVEKMPFPKYLRFLEDLAIDMGGTKGSLGVQEDRSVFVPSYGDGVIAPVICYESIYGDYVSEYLRNGANFIFIITNDGWWDDTPGYKQHLLYGRLRAIETRKSIARSANTGISCFINRRGDIEQATTWWQPAAIKGTLTSQTTQTFYTRHGDFIGIACLYIALASISIGSILYLLSYLQRFKNK
ncbi:MAG: apolipoprotein N-acyltransferase [Bacteroidetes bacterium]|nr:apolipoprotein N-acyltransferase [Bacteroidota bacterium]